jgi:hypothetical protein
LRSDRASYSGVRPANSHEGKPGGEAAQGVVFTQDSKTIIVQFDVERALALYAVRDRKLVDTGERIKLAAGPVSIRSMPR